MKTWLRVLALCTLAFVSSAAWAKSEIIKIAIVGPGLTAPLEITDPTVLERFNIWNGPGVRVNGQPVHLQNGLDRLGAFIDWSQGPLATPPGGSGLYDVTFHLGGREPMRDWHRRYFVKYSFDAATEGGYIYLPGRGDGEMYERNVFSIAHGAEGNWLHAAPAWEKYVRPRIAEAAARLR